MNRRYLLLLLATAAAARPLAAQTQPIAVPVVGFLSSGSAEGFATLTPPFLEGLKEAGYREGENVAIEYAWAAGKYDQLPSMAADLVQKKVSAIVATGGAVAASAAKAATSTIPIVIAIGDDPVKFGLVGSLGRPGGNITGVTLFMGELAPKRLELLAELAPAAALTISQSPQSECRGRSGREPGRSPAKRARAADHQSRRREGDRCRARRGRTTAGYRVDSRHRSVFLYQARADRRFHSPTKTPGDLLPPRVRGGRRPDELRRDNHRGVSQCRDLHRADPRRAETG